MLRSNSKKRTKATRQARIVSPSPSQGHQRHPSYPPPSIAVEDVTPLTNEEDFHPPRRASTKATLSGRIRRKHGDVEWRKKWNRHIDPFRQGRVLVVECHSRESSDDGRRKTQTQEFCNEAELSEYFDRVSSGGDGKRACLRIIHVQNAIWARSFLFKKYGILSNSKMDSAGEAFSRWAQYEKPQRRAGHPVLNARAFRIDKNVWRKVWRTGFGVDYLRYFTPHHMEDSAEPNLEDFKMMELDHWVEIDGNSYPAHGYDVYVQRLSVYIQRNMEDAGLAEDDYEDYPSPSASIHSTRPVDDNGDAVNVPEPPKEVLTSLDNTTTIIAFESSHSGSMRDTLIEARNEIERKWRRIFTDLPKDDIRDDSELGLQCLDIAIGYILNGLATSWEKLIGKCDEHISILEERIYENPADESRAPELTNNSSIWLKVEKLLYYQLSAIGNLKEYLRELAMEDDRKFFSESESQFKRVESLIDEDLLKPTTSLTDLMYKSVEIRDSRHSLQLGTSMWRLSWITFIFLPLTFLSGFFGMNVATFQGGDKSFPNIWWYFAIAIPLILAVIISVNLLKSMVDLRREDPLRRSTFESVYGQWAARHPHLWSRVGPRSYVQPRGVVSRVKWRIVRFWFNPAKTIANKPMSDINDMGLWVKTKHWVASSWLEQIRIDEERDLLGVAEEGRRHGAFEMVGLTAPAALADGNPAAAMYVGETVRKNLMKARSRSERSSSGSGSRPNFRTGSPSSQGVMVEEEDAWDDDDLDEDERYPEALPDDDLDRGRIEMAERAERSREREESPTAEGASALLGIPRTSRQVLTRADETK